MRSMPAGRGPRKARVHQPSTRGFSIQRRARFGANKPKTANGFPRDRPNSRGPDPVQRLARIASEQFPNRQPNWAALGSDSLALATSRPAPPKIHHASKRTLYGEKRPLADLGASIGYDGQRLKADPKLQDYDVAHPNQSGCKHFVSFYGSQRKTSGDLWMVNRSFRFQRLLEMLPTFSETTERTCL